MSPRNTPSTLAHLAATPVPASPACDRLADNRKLLANWLEQDRVALTQPWLGGWATQVVLPLIEGLRQHPNASLALGALARAWLQPAPADSAQTPELQALGRAIAVLRRHPKSTLAMTAIAGAGWWWNRKRPHTAASTSTSSN